MLVFFTLMLIGGLGDASLFGLRSAAMESRSNGEDLTARPAVQQEVSRKDK